MKIIKLQTKKKFNILIPTQISLNKTEAEGFPLKRIQINLMINFIEINYGNKRILRKVLCQQTLSVIRWTTCLIICNSPVMVFRNETLP